MIILVADGTKIIVNALYKMCFTFAKLVADASINDFKKVHEYDFNIRSKINIKRKI